MVFVLFQVSKAFQQLAAKLNKFLLPKQSNCNLIAIKLIFEAKLLLTLHINNVET
jgi:hypothetical protein